MTTWLVFFFRKFGTEAVVDPSTLYGWLEYSAIGRMHYSSKGQAQYTAEGRTHYTPAQED